MAEPHPGAELDQPGRLGRARPPRPRSRAARPRATAASRRRPARPPRPAAAAGSRRQRLEPAQEALLDPAASGRASGSPKPPASSAGVSPRGSSSSASGLPRVSATIRSRTRSSSAPADRRRQQRAGVARRRAPRRRSSGRPASSRSSLGSRTANTSATAPPAAAGRRTQRLRRGPVEPLRVVDQADQRPLLGRLGEQAQHGQADQEAIGRRRRAAARTPSAARRAAAPGSRSQPVEHRRAQLVQPGERELHLRLARPRPARRGQPGARSASVLQQRRLADARLAAQHQHRALARPGALQQPVEHVALAAAAAQHRRRLPGRVTDRSGLSGRQR